MMGTFKTQELRNALGFHEIDGNSGANYVSAMLDPLPRFVR